MDTVFSIISFFLVLLTGQPTGVSPADVAGVAAHKAVTDSQATNLPHARPTPIAEALAQGRYKKIVRENTDDGQ